MENDTLLLRQVHPAFVQNDRATSQAFTPTSKDIDSGLSVYDNELIDVSDSVAHYQNELNGTTYGVLAVTVDECKAKKLEARSDPTPFPEHAVIDFGGVGKAKVKKIAKKLSAIAYERGWLVKV